MQEARFQTSLLRVDEKPPMFLFLLQSLTEATDFVAEDHGTTYPKKRWMEKQHLAVWGGPCSTQGQAR
jgi:hypothetical protein